MSEHDATNPANQEPAPNDSKTPLEPAKKKITQLSDRQLVRAKQKTELGILLAQIKSITPNAHESYVEQLEVYNVFDRCATLPRAYEGEILNTICDVGGLHPAEAHIMRGYVAEIREERKQEKSKGSDNSGSGGGGNSEGKGSKKIAPKNNKARREDYWDLMREVLGDLKRDIFSGDLMCQDEAGLWIPAVDELDRVRSQAAYTSEHEDIAWTQGLWLPHFRSLENRAQRQLIVEIPEWDGVDRAKCMAGALVLDDSQGFGDHEERGVVAEEFVKDWLCKLYKRIENPRVQNRCLILKGPQGVGKDYWIDTMTAGLGQWATNLVITRNEADNLLQLSRAAVLKISEFDRTATQEVAMLKHMITADSTDVRAPYAVSAKRRQCRCSFISSCNVEDIYRDATGHRRYIVLNLADIKRGTYPDSLEDSRQILAQAKRLAQENYAASEKSEVGLTVFLDEKKPDTVEDFIVDTWEEIVDRWLNRVDDTERFYNFDRQKVEEDGVVWNYIVDRYGLLENLCRQTKLCERILRNKLKLMGMEVRTAQKRGYKLGRYAVTSDPSVPF